MDLINISSYPHDFNYHCKIATYALNTAEKHYYCYVGCFITDNAANVTKMQDKIKNIDRSNMNIIAYGCSAHIFNLLAKDMKISNANAQFVDSIKYLLNNYFASAKLLGK